MTTEMAVELRPWRWTTRLPRVGYDQRAMTVHVLYFAALREAVGMAEEWLELPASVATIADLAEHLALRHRAFGDHRAHVRIARNEAFATDDERLCDGDVVALIPPVAGG